MRPKLHRADRSALLLAHRRALGCIAVCALLFPTRGVSEGVVTNCTEAELRVAMSGGGLVSFACDGTITLSNSLMIATSTDFDASGHSIILNGAEAIRLFNVAADVSLALTNLTIANGWAADVGAGILNIGGLVEISGCVFSNNIVTGVNHGEDANGKGGAIFNTGTLNVRETTFINNSAVHNPWTSGCCLQHLNAAGGAIFNQGTAFVSRSLFVGNGAAPAIYIINPGTGIAYTGSGSGGAIFSSGALEVNNSTFYANRSSGANAPGSESYGGNAYGGGLYNTGNAVLLNNTFSSNTVTAGSGTRGNCGPNFTCGGPGVGQGGAVVNSGGHLSATNCIFANTPSGGDTSGLDTNSGHNLFGPVDPQLAPLNANGGSTRTLALLPASPAINAGDGTACPPTDQRGVARPFGSGCDIGAYEYNGSMVLPDVSMTYTPGTIHLGTTSFLALTVSNANATRFTQMVLTNELPPGIVLVSSPPTLSCPGTVIGDPGGSQVRLTNTTLNAQQSCVISLCVIGVIPGKFSNAQITVVSPEIGRIRYTNATVLTVVDRPIVATLSATAGPDTTTFNATVNAQGSPTLAYFQWGTTTNLDNSTTPQPVAAAFAAVPVTYSLTGLPPNTRFYYRVAASNVVGVSLGDIQFLDTIGGLAGGLTTITVCDESALRTNLAAGGTIRFACDGVILLSSPLTISTSVILDGSGHNVTLSGNGAVRVLQVEPYASLTLIHVTIANGHSSNGAGIYNQWSTTLIDCILATNRAAGLAGTDGTNTLVPGQNGANGTPGTSAYGGGIFNTGLLRITNTVFIGNTAQGGGGGGGGRGGDGQIYYNAGRCRSTGPGGGGTAANGGDGFGGAIYNLGDAVIHNASIVGNRAAGGTGGAGGTSGNAPCLVEAGGIGGGGDGGNAGAGFGGAIYNPGRLAMGASALFGNIVTGGNGGSGGTPLTQGGRYGVPGVSGQGNGGGVFNSGTNTMVNVTIALNTTMSGACADAVGGAFDNAGKTYATNCTLWANAALGGIASNGCSVPGGGFAAGINTRSNALTVVLNSIVGSPTSTSNCLGVITDGGHNICSDASAAFSAPGSLNNSDPKLGPLVDNGGPTLTMGLAPGSPALDAGEGGLCPSTDQRGVARPVGAGCDIGAAEGGDALNYPELRQTFAPATIPAGTQTMLQLTLSNSNPRILSNISFTNRLPAGILVAPATNLQSDCGGTVLVGEATIAVFGVSLAAYQSCSISVDVTSLVPGKYTNFAGPVYSMETAAAYAISSAVLAVIAPPVATTGLSSGRTATSGTLNASVDPNGVVTVAHFEFGSTTNYGLQTPWVTVGSSWDPLPVANLITGLAPASGYHFRVAVASDFGTTFGRDQYLLTLGAGPGTGVSLDGLDEFVITPDLRSFFTNETVTIEVWFRPHSAGIIVDENGQLPPTNGWRNAQMEILQSGEVRARIWPLAAVSLGTVSFGSWHHAVLRYEKTSTNLDGFLNGVESASDVKGDRNAPWESGYALFYAFGLGDGAHLGGGGSSFQGEIGEIRIWNTARTADEIRSKIHRRLTGTEPGLVCYWHFDEGMGTNASDASGHGNAGTLLNGIHWVLSTGTPLARTGPATQFSWISATLNATANPNGTETIAYFEFGLTTDYGMRTDGQNLGTGGEYVAFSLQAPNLVSNAVYHYRAVAANSFGTNYGDDISFSTLSPAPGVSVSLDGVNDFILTPDLRGFFLNETVTIELWFKPLAAGVVIDERGQSPSTQGWQDSQMEILASGDLRVRVWNLTPLSLGTASFGNWHHAVLRYDKAAARLDGFLDGAVSLAGSAGDRAAPPACCFAQHYGFGLGDSPHLGSGAFFKGQLDEIRIWNTARTAEEIINNMFRRLAGTEPGLVCYLRLDDRAGTTAYDSSGHGNAGMLFNGAAWVTGPALVGALLGISWLPDGRVQLDYAGLAGTNYVMQASTDLMQWSAIATNQAAVSGSVQFFDNKASNFTHRFYRAMRP